jgi:ferredoxin-NADP reductase
MFKIIDNFLNKITMYKLILYYLVAIIFIAFILCLFGVLSYSPLALLFSTFFILAVCFLFNWLFAWAFNAPSNNESVYITALILVLIITPISNPTDLYFFSLAFWASVLAMASKYLLAIKKKHIFNPAAIAIAITALALNQNASWWVGTSVLAPVVIIGGLLIVKKIARFDLLLSFLVVALPLTIYSFMIHQVSFAQSLWMTLTGTAVLFFAFVMLTEPLTTPPTRLSRILYGIFTGLLFWPALHVGNIYITPIYALVLGNVLSYLLSPKQKLILTLKKVIHSAPDIYDFIFNSDQRLKFKAGQYLEWTIDGEGADSRGNRRYFTIASSPTEDVIALAVRFPEQPSTFKQRLLNLKVGDTILAGQLAGDFVLPKDTTKKIVLIAGGIGITPYYSMIKNTIDTGEKRDIVLLYSNKKSIDAIYKFLWDEAKEKIGLKTIYAVTDSADPAYTGRLTKEMIQKEIPDYLERYFYLSGPNNLVTSFDETLRSLGIKRSHIKKDYFPGFV